MVKEESFDEKGIMIWRRPLKQKSHEMIIPWLFVLSRLASFELAPHFAFAAANC